MSSDEEQYYDVPEDPNDNLIIIQDSDRISSSELNGKRNRIESLKQSIDARAFDLKSDLPILPEFSALTHSNVEVPYRFDFGDDHQLSTQLSIQRHLDAFSSPLSSTSPRFLSRTLPERSSFTTSGGVQSVLFGNTRLMQSFRLTEPHVSGDNTYIPRSRTTQPVFARSELEENATKFSPPIPMSVRFPKNPSFFPDEVKPAEMASAPEVSTSRRSHAEIIDYVKSWSLDAARYRPPTLSEQETTPQTDA